MAWVAAAGPAANLVMALVWALLLKLVHRAAGAGVLSATAARRGWRAAGIVVNLVFMVLNLLPILPLDGGRIVVSLLPQRARVALREASSRWRLMPLLHRC